MGKTHRTSYSLPSGPLFPVGVIVVVGYSYLATGEMPSKSVMCILMSLCRI